MAVSFQCMTKSTTNKNNNNFKKKKRKKKMSTSLFPSMHSCPPRASSGWTQMKSAEKWKIMLITFRTGSKVGEKTNTEY